MQSIRLHRETRVRFLAGLIGVAIICIHNLWLHDGLVRLWSMPGNFGGPQAEIHDYGWYLWHIYHDEALQQIGALLNHHSRKSAFSTLRPPSDLRKLQTASARISATTIRPLPAYQAERSKVIGAEVSKSAVKCTAIAGRMP